MVDMVELIVGDRRLHLHRVCADHELSQMRWAALTRRPQGGDQ
jgi:hypothetical protein